MTTNTNAALPDAVRVPLDSLHADAEYLCARLLDKSLTREEVVTAIRFRIDAAKAALTTAAAVPPEGWVMVPVEPTPEIVKAIDGVMWPGASEKAYRAMRAAAPTTQAAPHLPERDATVPAEQQGLFRKFDVRRIDGTDRPGGKHHGCLYFVLDVDHDPCARAALTAYAVACEATHPALAADLRSKWGAVPATQASPQPAVQQGEPDWDDVRDQAETATGLQVERHTFSIIQREVRKWLTAQTATQGDAEDAARLDFMIEHRAYVVSDPDACPGYWLHFVHKETGRTWVQGDEHTTPRAAIDAARSQAKEGA